MRLRLRPLLPALALVLAPGLLLGAQAEAGVPERVVSDAGTAARVAAEKAAQTAAARRTTALTTSFVVTSPTDASRRLLPVTTTTRRPTVTLTVDASAPAQTWWGTGGALTDASVSLLADDPAALRLLFDPTSADGARLDALRLPLTATDFSPTQWAWGWDGTTATPPAEALAAMDVVRRSLLPLRPDLRVVGAAWSAPAAMKTTGTLRGGSLATSAVPSYGAMLAAQSAELLRRGIPLRALTLGNEPGHSSDYATMTMDVGQLATLGRTVRPQLPAGVALWAGDHNWGHRAAYDQVVAAAPGTFDGSAYHCYEGSPTQMNGPTPFRIITECTGTTDGWASTFAWQMRNLVAVPVANGSSGLLMWNLALDAQNGPIDAGARWGCRTCRGLLRVDGSTVTAQPELYLLGHVTRAAQPGARVLRVRSTASGTAVSAFANPDGTTGVTGVNDTASTQVVAVKIGSTTRSYVVGPGELFTLRTP